MRTQISFLLAFGLSIYSVSGKTVSAAAPARASSSKSATPAQAAPASAPTGSKPASAVATSQSSPASLDTARARKLYQDGDFEQGIAILETALKEKRVVNHADSVFVFKHLGVMYAANENTRERGKYYMLQLLTIEPTARIMDMYASDMIYMIFKNIQEEFSISQARYARAERNLAVNQTQEPGQSAKTPSQSTQHSNPPKVGNAKTYLWLGAAAVTVGVGVAVYLSTNGEPAKPTNHEVK